MTKAYDQSPSIRVVPDGSEGWAESYAHLASLAGSKLDRWQMRALTDGLRRSGGRWSAFEVGLLVPRQNGKSYLMAVLLLGAMYLWPACKGAVFSAHRVQTARELQSLFVDMCYSDPELKAQIKKVMLSSGNEQVFFKNGSNVRFMTRTAAGGRGLTSDLIVFDEAYDLGEDYVAALMPTLVSRSDPQMWLTTSAPDYQIADCTVFSHLRNRALQGALDRAAYTEYSVTPHTSYCGEACDQHVDRDAPETWAKANPSFNVRLQPEVVSRMRESMSNAVFDREILGVGNYPPMGQKWSLITAEQYKLMEVDALKLRDPVVFVVDVNPERTAAAISAAGVTPQGVLGIELIDYREGIEWVPDRLKELDGKWKPTAIGAGAFGAAANLIDDLEALKPKAKVVKIRTNERVSANLGFIDNLPKAIDGKPGKFKLPLLIMANDHFRDATAAVTRISRAEAAGGFFLGRDDDRSDISPFVSGVHALWLYRKHGREPVKRTRLG